MASLDPMENNADREAMAKLVPFRLRVRRYMLEGGLRRIFVCHDCAMLVCAESKEEGREILNREDPCPCRHLNLETRAFTPPDDFS